MQELHWTDDSILYRRWRGGPFHIHVQRRRQAAAAVPLLTIVERRTRGEQQVPPTRWFPKRRSTAGKEVDFPELLSQTRAAQQSQLPKGRRGNGLCDFFGEWASMVRHNHLRGAIYP